MARDVAAGRRSCRRQHRPNASAVTASESVTLERSTLHHLHPTRASILLVAVILSLSTTIAVAFAPPQSSSAAGLAGHGQARQEAEGRYKVGVTRNAAKLCRLSTSSSSPRQALLKLASSSSSSDGGYRRPEESSSSDASTKRNKAPQPKIGDIVRYVDVDGGVADGEVLVGKISLIQPILRGKGDDDEGDDSEADADGKGKWLAEITELEDVGDGYYAEYPSRKRRKTALRPLENVSPLPASYVRSEGAYKVPRDKAALRPSSPYGGYDLASYRGPKSEPVNIDVVQADATKYGTLKGRLLRDAAIAGVAGTVLVDLFRGLDDALIYAAGAVAGVGYLFFLSIKTDTLGGTDSKLGSNVSNLRFALPLLVLIGVALRNVASGPESNPVANPGPFSSVSPEQFASAMLGFLTYRLPLFVGQLRPLVAESAAGLLPGSAGIALRMAQEANAEGRGSQVGGDGVGDEDLVPVLLVSGPTGTGKTTLVNRLLADCDDGRFVAPAMIDRINDGATFEMLERRDELLQVDPTGRYGLTREGILKAAEKTAAKTGSSMDDDDESSEAPQRGTAVVIDADVPLVKKLTKLSGARLIGVWVGLDSLDKFESRIAAKIDSGNIVIPPDETRESVLRAKVREIVQDIEYGVVSGIFEFTILNDDVEESVLQLKEAAEYCFK